jgi:hypothetical protein
MLQDGRSWVRVPDEVNELFSSIYLILPASDRNEYQKQKNNVSGEYSAAGEYG